MKNKWLVLCMAFMFGLVALPVFADSPTLGDGVFIGAQSSEPVVSQALHLSVEQLGTVMESLLALTLIVVLFKPLLKVVTGPAANVPERYDKARQSGLLGNLRKLRANLINSGRFKRQGS